MARRRVLVAVGSAVAVGLVLGGLVGGVLVESPSAGRSTDASPALAERTLGGTAAGVSEASVLRLEDEVRARPRDVGLLTQLGFAYQLRWRATADASNLPRSEAALERALRVDPGAANAVLGLGSLALIRHEFRDALVLGRRAKRLLPGSSRPFGVVGDALVELGRYREAFQAFDTMVSLRPSLASYARAAYVRELGGDRRGARSAMRLALEAAAGEPEPSAWAHVELAKLELGLGHADAAEHHVVGALALLPGYPSARAELARIEIARGRLARAVAEARRAAQAVPIPASVALLGDLLERAGDRAGARRQRATLMVLDRLLRANGVRVDLESAVYRADEGVRPLETIALARKARAYRPSIYGDDALAWALARAGRCGAALPLAQRALRLGTQDPLLFFHRGFAAGCAGRRTEMRAWYRRALALNREFSVRWAPVARAATGGG